MSRYYNPTRVDPSSDTCLRKRFHDRESRARFQCNSFIRHSRLPAQRLSRSRESGKTWGGNKRNKKVVKSERERDSADEVERGQRRSLLRGFARTPRRSPRVSKVPTTRVKWIRIRSPRQRRQRRWTCDYEKRPRARSPRGASPTNAYGPARREKAAPPTANGTAPRFPFIPSASASASASASPSPPPPPSPPSPTVGDAQRKNVAQPRPVRASTKLDRS